MNKRLAIFLGIGLVIAGVAAALIFMKHVSSHLEVKGEILKIRADKIDEANCVAILDIRLENVSDVAFTVRTITVMLENAAGEKSEGETLSRKAIPELLSYNKFLGQLYNDTISATDTIKPREKMDRSLVVRFDVPLDTFNKAKQIRLTIEDPTGMQVETTKPVK